MRHYNPKAILIQRPSSESMGGQEALPTKEQLRALRANWNGRVGEKKGGGGWVIQRHRQGEFEQLMHTHGVSIEWVDVKAQPVRK